MQPEEPTVSSATCAQVGPGYSLGRPEQARRRLPSSGSSVSAVGRNINGGNKNGIFSRHRLRNPRRVRDAQLRIAFLTLSIVLSLLALRGVPHAARAVLCSWPMRSSS